MAVWLGLRLWIPPRILIPEGHDEVREDNTAAQQAQWC